MLIEYEQSDRKVNSFEVDFCCNIPQDICEALENVMNNLPFEYGLTLSKEHFITINIFEKNQSIESILDNLICGEEYILNKVLLIRKDIKTKYNFKDFVYYEDNVLILKSLVVFQDGLNPHFYLYNRCKFTTKFILMNDSQLDEACLEQILNEPIFMAVYYVFDNKNDTPVNDNNSIGEECSEFIVPDDMKEIFKSIFTTKTDSGKIIEYGFKMIRNTREEDDDSLVKPYTRLVLEKLN